VEGRRVALLVATDRYQDSGLSRLAAPASDAKMLEAVLCDRGIAGFKVTRLYNKPNAAVGKAIGDFYRDCRRDDLTLLYFTGHGLKDDYGQLYLAMTDTARDNLQFTGVRGEQIRMAMEECRSRQNVLILDCCYAGAFPAGAGIKGDAAVHALEQLGGRGSVVLTSSDAMQYSFEGNHLTETGPAALRAGPSSLFTRFLVEGLSTGRADLDGDGNITLDELYGYVHDRVTEEQPQQRPKKKEDVEGRILFARNVHWTVPSQISNIASGPNSVAKLTALDELRGLYDGGNNIVRQRVLEVVRVLARDDNMSVSEAANHFLAESKKEPLAAERAPREVPGAGSGAAGRDQAFEEDGRRGLLRFIRRRSRLELRLAALASLAVVISAIIGGLLLFSSGPPPGLPPPPPGMRVTDNRGAISVVVPRAWGDVLGNGWIPQEHISGITYGTRIGPGLNAAPNIGAWFKDLTTPGIFVGASQLLVKAGYNPVTALSAIASPCDFSSTRPAASHGLTGYQDIWTCPHSTTRWQTVALWPRNHSFIAFIELKIVAPVDQASGDRALASLSIRPTRIG
jgi:hypothetical protein